MVEELHIFSNEKNQNQSSKIQTLCRYHGKVCCLLPFCCSRLKRLSDGCTTSLLKLDEPGRWFWSGWSGFHLILKPSPSGLMLYLSRSMSGLSDCLRWSNRLLSSFAKVADVRVIHAQQGRSSLWLQAESVKSFSNVLLMHKHSWGCSPSVVVKVFSLGRGLEEQMQLSQDFCTTCSKSCC